MTSSLHIEEMYLTINETTISFFYIGLVIYKSFHALCTILVE